MPGVDKSHGEPLICGPCASLRRMAAPLSALCALALSVLAAPSETAAHEPIDSTVPSDLATINETVDEVRIFFGQPIAGDVMISIVHDAGTGTVEIPGRVELVSESTVALEFDPIDQEGWYDVTYAATNTRDGHPVDGSFSFRYVGASSDHAFSVRTVLVGALAVLAIAAVALVVRAGATLGRA